MRNRTILFLIAAILVAPGAWASSRQPSGEGDPDATSCMDGDAPTGSQISPRFCATNAQWAALKKAGKIVGPDGKLVSNDPRDINAHMCFDTGGGGGVRGNSGIKNFNVQCN